MREKIDWEKVRELEREGKREGIWPHGEEAVARLVDSQQVGVRGRLNSTSGIDFRVRVIARKMGGGEVREWVKGRRIRLPGNRMDDRRWGGRWHHRGVEGRERISAGDSRTWTGEASIGETPMTDEEDGGAGRGEIL